MKKYLMTAVAALAAASFTSCSNEVDMFEPISSEKATIDLNITNDDAVVTRAIQNATTSEWWAKMGNNDWAQANTLEGKTYTPGTYSIQVGNFKSQADAMPDKKAGEPYYTLTQSVTLGKGTNKVDFACGTAKNGMVTVDWSGTSGVAGLTMTNVAASQEVATETTPIVRTYTYTAGGDAYFYAGAEVTFTINYTYNSVPKTITKKITPAAATQYAFNVKANSNGTITTLTITYNDYMENGAATTTTINAATGAEATGAEATN